MAFIVCMRKLLTMLNAMVSNTSQWRGSCLGEIAHLSWLSRELFAWSLVEIGTVLLLDAGPQGNAGEWDRCNITATRACLCKGIQPTRAVPTRFHAHD